MLCVQYHVTMWPCNIYSTSSMRKIVRYIGSPNLIMQHNFFVSEIMHKIIVIPKTKKMEIFFIMFYYDKIYVS